MDGFIFKFTISERGLPHLLEMCFAERMLPGVLSLKETMH